LSARLPANWSTGLHTGPVFFISGTGGDARLHATERRLKFLSQSVGQGKHMAWTTPILVEICIGLEINGYLPAEF
jgi:coenzyme PQQ precursor peptide PqqA